VTMLLPGLTVVCCELSAWVRPASASLFIGMAALTRKLTDFPRSSTDADSAPWLGSFGPSWVTNLAAEALLSRAASSPPPPTYGAAESTRVASSQRDTQLERCCLDPPVKTS
jgi:hypothetical protein